MGAGDKTKKQLELIERRELAVQLRLDGYTYREIANIMIGMSSQNKVELPDSYDERYAYRDVNTVIEDAKKNLVESGEVLRIMELRNLDRLQNGIMDRAINGDLDALDRVLKIMRQREKYVPDLTQPKQVNVKTWQSEIVQLIREGKITIEDVSNVYPQFAEKLMAELPDPRSQRELPEGGAAIEGEYVDLGETYAEVSREGGQQREVSAS